MQTFFKTSENGHGEIIAPTKSEEENSDSHPVVVLRMLARYVHQEAPDRDVGRLGAVHIPEADI